LVNYLLFYLNSGSDYLSQHCWKPLCANWMLYLFVYTHYAVCCPRWLSDIICIWLCIHCHRNEL